MSVAVQSNSRKAPNRSAGGMVTVVPFTGAAHEHTEPGGVDFTVQPGANTQQFGPFDVPAIGFLRHIWLLVTTTTAGTGGTVGATTDFPFNLFSEITLLDVNGGQIYGPMTGFQTFAANLFGSYAFRPDPRKAPDYSAGANSPLFLLRIPVEINHNNGLGALSNQNAAASYKLRLVVNTNANIYTGGTPASPAPILRVRTVLEAWTQPNAADAAGRPQAIAPPSHGTTQFWTATGRALVTGDNTILMTRVGNLVRNIVLIFRNSAGIRQAVANLPDPVDWRWDARQLLYEPVQTRRAYMTERTDLGVDTGWDGILAYQFTHDVLGHAGDGTTELYLATTQSSRLEFHSSNVPAALSGGTVEILMNDIAPVEVSPTARYDEMSATGFHGQAGAANAGAAS